jgi:hypothetical protein
MKSKLKLIVTLIIIVILVVINYFPLKFAVQDLNSIKNKEYIIIEEAKITDIEWKIIGDNYGFYDKNYKYASIIGEVPPGKFKLDQAGIPSNKYVCYGEYVGKEIKQEVQCEIFKVTKWDIIYPVIRELGFFAPRGSLNVYDLIFSN